MANKKFNGGKKPREASTYRHPEAESPLRPEVGTQAQFKKRKPPVTYKYDSSLSPALDWDGQNSARERGEALIREILDAESLEKAKSAAASLKAMSRPFLNWAGKAERLSFDVPTLPLFVHERLSTKGIIETLKGHKLDKQMEFGLFGDPNRSITDQVLKAYEYRDKWVNRMILGDSLVVMNSLLRYEGLGGQVQMIYIDPPYGVRFGSNFQPFVRKRNVEHNDDEDLTREPEMVRAYRDTWEFGLHSYLTYLRDRLLLARELLSSSGSVFVQISDENVHHVRELGDEVFGAENFISLIAVRTHSPLGVKFMPNPYDYIVWYAKDQSNMAHTPLFVKKDAGLGTQFAYVETSDGSRRRMTSDEQDNPRLMPTSAKPYRLTNLPSSGYTPSCTFDFEFEGKIYKPSRGRSWKTTLDGMNKLVAARRVISSGSYLNYVQYFRDFPFMELAAFWDDVYTPLDKQYVVETATKAIERCVLMTTSPGDLVLDPTCGSGTTAYVAEQWGRRWITIDTSRVPLALARQRILTATFPYYELKDEARGPAGGFVYKRKQNAKGEEVGGIVPHITLKSIANDEPPDEEVLVDRPETVNSITRVSGPFCVEATIPTPVEFETGSRGSDRPATGKGQSVWSKVRFERLIKEQYEGILKAQTKDRARY